MGIKKIINNFLKSKGYQISKVVEVDPVIALDKEFMEIYEKCKDYTMTSPENMYQLYLSVKYIVAKGIRGDFVECGVWAGGSAMVIAYTLLNLGVKNRRIWLYDTFEGMSEPSEYDITIHGEKGDLSGEGKGKYDCKCYSPLEDVTKNMERTEYPFCNIIMIKGKVEDTLKIRIPKVICLLRLDTDWYESTKEELEILYPLLQDKGIMIIDDYGCWQGAKKAVDDYFKNETILLNRIDGTARLVVK